MDEALNDPNGDLQDLLVTAAYDYITEHGLPSSPEAMNWIANPNYEEIISRYMAGSGTMSTDDWLRIISDVKDGSISIEPNGKGGIYIELDFDFDSGDDSPGQGSRTAKASI